MIRTYLNCATCDDIVHYSAGCNNTTFRDIRYDFVDAGAMGPKDGGLPRLGLDERGALDVVQSDDDLTRNFDSLAVTLGAFPTHVLMLFRLDKFILVIREIRGAWRCI